MKKIKKYLRLESFYDDGVTKFGWKSIPPNRKRSPKTILNNSLFIKSFSNSTGEECYMADSDIERYIILSLGMSAKELYTGWSDRVEEFEQLYSQLSTSYSEGDGEFFLKLSHLYLNDVSFTYKDKEFCKVSYS